MQMCRRFLPSGQSQDATLKHATQTNTHDKAKRRCSSAKRRKIMPPRSVLIVPALPIEAKAILSFFEDVNVKSTPSGTTFMTGNRKIFSTKLGEKIKEHWEFFIATPTGAGNLEITRALHRLLPECDPQLVALIGCAGGFPKMVEQFDVVVPPRVDYIARTKVSKKTELRPQQEACSNTFVDHCKNVQLLGLWHQYLLPDVSNAPINVYFEPIVSGETVLVNSRSEFFRSALLASPKAVAIEMESYGFLSVCREHRVEAAVLRGISDTLDNKNETGASGKPSKLGLDHAQYKATRHAAALFFATLDFINAHAFSRNSARAQKEVTEVYLILDAEMHDVPEIQADLFELFKKYGIRNFSFRPANSVRIGYEAEEAVMRIYEALIGAGIINSVAGFKILTFKVKTPKLGDHQLAEVLDRIATLKGGSANDLLKLLRIENWVEEFPDLTRIIVDALEHQQQEDAEVARKRTRRILYPDASDYTEEAQVEKHLGQRSPPSIILTNPGKLREALASWQPMPASNELLAWFMGKSLLDRDLSLDVLLAYSNQKFFYTWPGLGTLFDACNLPETGFVEGCLAEWQMIRRASKPTILQILNQESWDRLGRGQIRDAVAHRPATLNKALQILSLTCRILSQNGIPVRGCIVPSLYSIMFNGTIAGDGAVERMLLTGMAGDLTRVAGQTGLPLRAVQNAIRGATLPYLAAREFASALDRLNTRLRVAMTVLDSDKATARRREAVDLDQHAAQQYLRP